MEEINIKDFWEYYRKYLLIVVMVVLLAVLSTFIYNKVLKKPLYSTYTTVLLVKDDSNDPNETISQSDITLNQKLVSTYREIIKSKLVLEQVIKECNLDYSYGKLNGEVDVKAVSDTEILKITVTDASAEKAAIIANSVATVFDREISKIYKINNVSVIDRAEIPKSQSNNKTARDMILIGMLSFIGSSAIIFVIFYFDDTLRNVEDISDELGIPVIGKIFKDTSGIDLIVDKKPKANTSESIRTLRTNLQFSAVDSELKTILITSSLPSEGKSYISANLAVSFAQAGKSVLLIDCDLRKGRQHKIFDIAGKDGLSNLLISNIKSCSDFIFPTKIKNLSIMPRGIVPPNPSELLNSKKNEALINLLKKYYDIIILDGAPITGLSDSLILSTYVDRVLLVGCINHTLKTEIKNAKNALEGINANLAGCIANNVVATKGGYGSYYYYGVNDND